MEATGHNEKWMQNLKDAGCEGELIARFLELSGNGEMEKALQLLAAHRRELLAEFHRCDDRIGCLDYLVHQIQKEQQTQNVDRTERSELP